MFLKEKVAQDCTTSIAKLLSRLNSLIEENDINSNILKLQSIGFNLESIHINGYSVIGIFKNNNYIKEIQIPFYKINKDILDQLESLVEEYNTYLFEEQKNICENDIKRIKKKELIDINSNEINWDQVYNTKIYTQIALNTTIELLYVKLFKELDRSKYFHSSYSN